jgi:hypothetical protein
LKILDTAATAQLLCEEINSLSFDDYERNGVIHPAIERLAKRCIQELEEVQEGIRLFENDIITMLILMLMPRLIKSQSDKPNPPPRRARRQKSTGLQIVK